MVEASANRGGVATRYAKKAKRELSLVVLC
jgi:hypothetical protein